MNLGDELLECICRRNLMDIEKLLVLGVDVHVYDDCALRWASQNGYVEIVEVLLEAGADVHVFEDDSLYLAGENGHISVAVKLVEAGASLQALGECWFGLFGCEAPDGLVKMDIEKVVELMLVEAVAKELA